MQRKNSFNFYHFLLIRQKQYDGVTFIYFIEA